MTTNILTVYFCKFIKELTMFPSTRWLLLYLLDAIVAVMGLCHCRRTYEVTSDFGEFFLSFSELSASKNDMPVPEDNIHIIIPYKHERRTKTKGCVEVFNINSYIYIIYTSDILIAHNMLCE